MNQCHSTVFLAALLCVPAAAARAETASGGLFLGTLGAGFARIAATAAAKREVFRLSWNGSEYVCKNGEGRLGYNKIEVRELLRTKSGECADLEGMPLRYVDLMGADLDGARLGKSDLTGANLHGASLNGADLSRTLLSLANLGGAQMIAVYAVEANLSMAVLTDAKLTKAHLTDADLSAAHLVAAELSGADLRSAVMEKTHLERSTYDSQTRLPFGEDEAAKRGMFKIHR